MSNENISTEQETSHDTLAGVSASLIHWLVDRSEDELALIWVELNRWNWPEAIPLEYKPKWWDKDSGYYHPRYNQMDRKQGFNEVVMHFCKASVPKGLVGKYWKERTNSH